MPTPFLYPKKKKMIYQKESGFSLVELAIVITIIGLLMAGMITGIKLYLDKRQMDATKEKLEVIADSLSLFAQKYGRLPCPGDPAATASSTPPYGAPRNSGAGGTDILTNGCVTPPGHGGIVPYKALGLDKSYDKDAYGHLITYFVTSVVAGDPTAVTLVHSLCRSEKWIPGAANINLRKAAICCARYNGVEVKVYSDKTLANEMYSGVHAAAGYGDPNTRTTLSDHDNKFIAFVLVSHGPNGDGAYIAHTATTVPVTASATAQEAENRNGNRFFVDRPISKAPSDDYFDDIVVWRTNEQLISAFGNDSCAAP